MPISGQEAMGMNRHERRVMGKVNGVKIPGTNNAHLKLKVIANMREKNMPEYLIEFYDKNNRMPTEAEYLTLQNESKDK